MEFEKKQFDNLAIALDSVIVNKYHYILQELKVGWMMCECDCYFECCY